MKGLCMTAVEIDERTLDDVAATASFTWGLSFSRSDVSIVISALHNLTDFSGEEIEADVAAFWGKPVPVISAESAVVFVYLIMENLWRCAAMGGEAELSVSDMRVIAVALDDLAGRDKGDATVTYGELEDANDETLNKILAEDGELQRYCALLRDACAKFVATTEAVLA